MEACERDGSVYDWFQQQAQDSPTRCERDGGAGIREAAVEGAAAACVSCWWARGGVEGEEGWRLQQAKVLGAGCRRGECGSGGGGGGGSVVRRRGLRRGGGD
eukprot:6194663-Pleurochrysis_carterae.AAC.1